MARVWIRKNNSVTATTQSSFVSNQDIYQNSRTVTGNITLVQKATVVAMILWAVTDNDNTWSMTPLVVDESVTPTYGTPEVDAQQGSDPEVKGHYIFARGPLMYQPKRLISIPVESKLTIRINKEVGGDASVFRYHVQCLINTSL